MIYRFLSLCKHVLYLLPHYPARKLTSSHLVPLSLSPIHPPDPSFPPIHLPPIPLFLSSIHLWSLSSFPPSTSDPPFPHFPALWSPALPRAVRHVPVCELLVQEPACVVAPGQGWHSPAGMRGNRVWAFLYKRTIKPTAVHNELILIQVRCTSYILCLSFAYPSFFSN